MADRVSASITIGGTLSATLLPDLLAAIENEGLSTQWDGEPFAADQLVPNEPLALMAHEVAWGHFSELEVFCIEQGLPFARWSGAYHGQWGAQRVVFSGNGEPLSFAADEDDTILIDRSTAERLDSIEAIFAHFDAADFAIPALVIVAQMEETAHG
ncbi:hypothetical protein [Sphingobium subterraneum]|uniref:Uncharacterized protein n=1 Tax=Sphingobium subterraneum TaxID=627688 RepID=A0A841J3P0_9SPHN|nr:hypothetical protein [Sphingobium subterraneum]MBB6125404.1 hypothetical protein [Sphingobium subterraneum]